VCPDSSQTTRLFFNVTPDVGRTFFEGQLKCMGASVLLFSNPVIGDASSFQ